MHVFLRLITSITPFVVRKCAVSSHQARAHCARLSCMLVGYGSNLQTKNTAQVLRASRSDRFTQEGAAMETL